MYYLKLFDKDLISFDMTSELGLKISNVNIIDENKDIYPILLRKEVNENSIENFIKSRVIPKNRAFVKQILESLDLNINDKKGVIDISKGLSLTDCYWIVEDPNLKFDDYNLYDNDFSEVLSLIAFTGYTSKIKNLISSPEFTTNGMLPKCWRRIDNKVYLYKGSTADYEVANTGFEPYSEYYASQIGKQMGVNVIDYKIDEWKNKLVSICEIFTSKDYSYVQIGDLMKNGNIREAYEICMTFGLEEEFADMILFDSIIMNEDRHFGNFGFLRNNHTGRIEKFAPIFDNGSSLQFLEMPRTFENKEEFMKSIQSKGKNISYYGASYEELVSAFCNKKQILKLKKLLTYNIEKDEKYNLPEERLDCLNDMVKLRARTFLDLLEKK